MMGITKRAIVPPTAPPTIAAIGGVASVVGGSVSSANEIQ